MSQSKSRAIASLIGKCFVIYRWDGSMTPGRLKIERQGQIAADLNNGHYLVQFFDWISGAPSTLAIFSVETMRAATTAAIREAGGWEFFEDDAHMRSWMDNNGRQYRS